MTVRRLNYTRRKKLHREDVDIVLYQDVEPASFSITLNLNRYQFPPDAVLHVEAYRRTRVMRFTLGTVGALRLESRYPLSDFAKDEEIHFRIKVTEASGRSGLLLGHADRLRPRRVEEVPEKRVPILPPIPADLEDEVWRLEFDDEPKLYVNNRLPDWTETVRSNEFRALVYPAIVRDVFVQMLLVDRDIPSDGDDTWQGRWMEFAKAIPGVRDLPKDNEDYQDWINDAAASFARRFAMRQRYVGEMTVDDSQGTQT